MKLSVITVTKNASQHIATCMDSVKAQTYHDVEHIIIDGASTDDTVALARARLRPSDQLVSEPDGGIYEAMNRGITRATGDYILFLGADDYLVDSRVLADAARFAAAEGVDAFYGDLEVRYPNGSSRIFRPPDPDRALDLMICGCLPHQATFAHRDVFKTKVGMFDTRYQVHADYDWFLRLLDAPNVKIRHLDRVIASFLLGGTSSRLEVGQQEAYAIQNSYPLYRKPEWMERRLLAFQQELLAARIELQEERSGKPHPSRRFGARLRRAIGRVTARLAGICSP